MPTTLETGAEAIPCAARLSSAFAAEEITPAEYNAALRVAELEDSVKKPFCRATWRDVKKGDTVLKAWASLDRIVEIEIEQCVTEPGLDGKPLVIARFNFDGLHYGQAFGFEDVVYVQSRL